MARRVFLKLTVLVAAASAFEALPVAAALGSEAMLAEHAGLPSLAPGSSIARLRVSEPGTYRLVGRVRLEAPLVEVQGIAHPQTISWAGAGGAEAPVVSFTTFEHFEGPRMSAAIQVRGGRLEGLTALPVDFA